MVPVPGRLRLILAAVLGLGACASPGGGPAPDALPVPRLHAALFQAGPFWRQELEKAFAAQAAQPPAGLDAMPRPVLLGWPEGLTGGPARRLGSPPRTEGLAVPNRGPSADMNRMSSLVPAAAEVVLRFAIAADGRVVNAQLIRAAQAEGAPRGEPPVGAAALGAVAQWRFTPPTQGGRPRDFCCIELQID